MDDSLLTVLLLAMGGLFPVLIQFLSVRFGRVSETAKPEAERPAG